MLAWVVVPAVGLTWWTWRTLTDPRSFADSVGALPAHRVVRRTARRHVPRVAGPLVDRVLDTDAMTAFWRRAAIAGHRRARRPRQRAIVVGLAGAGRLAQPAGRWRLAAWILLTIVVGSTIRGAGGL